MPIRVESVEERSLPAPVPNGAASAIPVSGARIAAAALALIRNSGALYAFDSAPTSLHPNLSGNRRPGFTPLEWLRNRYKCNQFAGDVLTLAGAAMPTYLMPDGSEHYLMAEELPRRRDYFSSLESPRQLLPGDLVVIDYPGAHGTNGAHVEIVITHDDPAGLLTTAGAHHDGAYVKDNSDLLERYRRQDELRLHLLRPKKGPAR